MFKVLMIDDEVFMLTRFPRILRRYCSQVISCATAKDTSVSAGHAAFAREKFVALGGFDELYRPFYWEDIDLCYRAMQAGWERWYVPDAVVTHDYAAVIDRRFLSRHTLWHARGMARFVRKHPERLLAL